MRPPASRAFRRAAYRTALFAFLCGSVGSHTPPGWPLLGALASAVPERAIAPRLSITSVYRACPSALREGETIPRADCGPLPGREGRAREVDAVTRGAARMRRLRLDPQALQAQGLLDLLAADSVGNSLGQSISSFALSRRRSKRRAPVLADQAAAHLLRAERTQSVKELAQALELAQEAAGLEPGSPVALFNRALALDRLAVDGRTVEAWEAYLAVDSTSGWAEEARARVRALARPRPAPAPPASADSARVEAYVAAAPLAARELGWDRLLGEWGEAVLAGDPGRAGERLRRAEALGAALERRGGDATLADAARAIRAHARDPRATRLLASAHREYARGREAYRDADKKGAGDHCARVLEIAPPSPALRGWAGVYRAAGISFEGDHSRAVAEFEAQRAKVDTARHPALAATLHSGLATALLRGGSHQRSRDASRTAARHYTRAGERESEGGEIFQQATTEFGMGLDWEAYATTHRALVTLRDFRASRFLHALLLSASQSLADDGFRHTALALQDEAVAVAGRTRVRAFVAESHARRAQLRAGLGDSAGAETDARAAARHLDDVVLATWPWITADLRLVRGRLRLRTDPAGALAAFDSVAVAVDTARTVRRYVLALVGAAEARLALGDAAGAAADLQQATERLGLQGSAIETASLRASLLDGAREVFDRLVMLEVARGREREALEFLERGRVSFPPAGPREGAAAGVARPPAGSVAVVYALIGDTLLTWTVAGDTVRLVRQTVDGAGLLARVDGVRALEGSRDEAAARSALASLYDRLVRPVEGALGGAETPLALVADGELTRVPFSALYDARRRRYLVEAHPLRFASSLRDAARAPSDAAAAGAGALVVADPAFDPRMYALEPLREAEAEARTVAATYPGARVLPGREATPSALRAALPGARLFHFAGHAVFDDDRPGRSFLVLAPDSGGASRLMADEVAGMDLRGVGVVVLSACETLPSREGRSGGFAGFAGAFLAAGADGVVGSLWPVDDRRTRPLMVAFHRAYGRSGDGAAALRAAQLELLRGHDPDLASPSTWAAFRYAGR